MRPTFDLRTVQGILPYLGVCAFARFSEMRPAFQDVFITSDDVEGKSRRCVTLPLETGSDPQTDRRES